MVENHNNLRDISVCVVMDSTSRMSYHQIALLKKYFREWDAIFFDTSYNRFDVHDPLIKNLEDYDAVIFLPNLQMTLSGAMQYALMIMSFRCGVFNLRGLKYPDIVIMSKIKQASGDTDDWKLISLSGYDLRIN